MKNDLQDVIGRILWRDGQTLASPDLRGELEDETRRRRLHNRFLHRTWGIALGLTTRLQSGGAGVLVSPGYAVDREGRDLLLAQPLQIPLPANGTFVLAATYDTSAPCRPSLSTADFCGGLDPRRERALIGWVAMADLNMGVHVPLARAVVAQGKLVGSLDLRVRRLARRMVRPHIGRGITATGATNWVDATGLKTPVLWLQADVDTSEAGFLKTPRYFAALCRRGPARKHPRPGSLDAAAGAFRAAPSFSLDGPGFITKATPNKFTYRVPRGALPFGVDLTASEAEAGGWVVAWLGIESVAGCQPQLNLSAILAVLGTTL